ncbi:flagellar export protein FliJ [Dichotomicrobium thermohalophilum]|uniref:Flagellar export protein FliJ n=1 Tax=Dichotomicrobium thermohalophilum TaxID=933063 RepID=A0A397Q3D7_9HYPH|nr:flagellar export protein FliJ [Dichotomicrobium thermohalophilum]RIA55548.1 flagellar export protein FliJ [Dichotomicrobium thermohalophilum]
MPSRQRNFRSRRFELEERQQKVADIEAMIEDFTRVADELERQLRYEEQRSGITDPNHFAYPIYAKAARQRRDNLLESIRDLNAKLEEERAGLEQARTELQTAEMFATRDALRSRRSSDDRFSGNMALERD